MESSYPGPPPYFFVSPDLPTPCVPLRFFCLVLNSYVTPFLVPWPEVFVESRSQTLSPDLLLKRVKCEKRSRLFFGTSCNKNILVYLFLSRMTVVIVEGPMTRWSSFRCDPIEGSFLLSIKFSKLDIWWSYIWVRFSQWDLDPFHGEDFSVRNWVLLFLDLWDLILTVKICLRNPKYMGILSVVGRNLHVTLKLLSNLG